MKKQELIDLGIEDADVQKSILRLYGLGIESFKSDVATLTGEKETLTAQLLEAGATIEGFKEMDVEAIKKSADDWQSKAEQAKTDADEAKATRDSDVAKLKFDHALDGALGKAKAKNIKSVKALLKMDDLKLDDDGSISGLIPQLETIVADNDFLFDSVEPEDPNDPKIVLGSKKKSILGDPIVTAARDAAGVSGKDK